MATAADLDFTYTQIDRLVRLSLGETADFSGAKYDGDFSLSLEQAQRRKHDFIATSVGLRPGFRVIDLGCGWGPFLRYARERGAKATGLTLSRGQAAACRRNGLDVHVLDCRAVTRDAFGAFDGAASVGAFEHFCSPEAFRDGQQEAVYAGFFRAVRGLLGPQGRLYLQTMVFGRNMIPHDRIDIDAPRGSDAHVLALMGALFPGSWLPYGLAQVERAAAPHFRIVSAESGRLDYIETIRQWRLRFARFSWPKLVVQLSLVPRYLTSRNFRNAFTSGISANTICFERELFDHFRIVLEAVGAS
ncbi:MAG TPA: class I SAM-dependent methyltransferase [Candidatus Eisenbacteria bacterium]